MPPCLMTKKPSPWMAKSVERPVDCAAPCEKLVPMPARRTPRPICAGLVPPVIAEAGAPAPCIVWLSRSSNSTVPALKPVVLTLAMLFPTKSMNVWCAWSPETAANIERSIWIPLSVFQCLCARQREMLKKRTAKSEGRCLHLHHRRQWDIATADLQQRAVGSDANSG